MTNAIPIQEFTGFTEEEVKELCIKYNRPFDEMKRWYDGYCLNGVSLYNPRSVVQALLKGAFDNYWTQTETFEAEAAHQENTAILKYNDENSLLCVMSLAYYSAKKSYTMVREMPAGKGFADLVFIPNSGVSTPAMVVELKHDKTAETALQQIRDKNYT